MGAFNIDMSGIMQQLDRLDNMEAVSSQMLDEGLKELEKDIKDAYGAHVLSGSLRDSIHVRKQSPTYGYVSPEGSDARGVRNAEKATYLEYGTYKQTATPVIQPAVSAAEPRVVECMTKKFEELMPK